MKRYRKKHRSYRPFIFPIIMLVLATGVTIFILNYSNFGSKGSSSQKSQHLISVPASRVEIDAYSQVSREHLTFIKLDKQNLPDGVVVNLGDVAGRVLKKDKREGYVFKKEEFYPKGTKPGFTAAIPAGKRALSLNIQEIKGLSGLTKGDHFDLFVVSEPKSKNVKKNKNIQQYQRQKTRPMILIRNGIIIQTQSNKKNASSKKRNSFKNEYVVAVDLKEVSRLLRALQSKQKLFALARSNSAEDLSHDYWRSYDAQEQNKQVMVEKITEDERKRVAVPKE